ncbi:n utilization substance protein B homolog [Clostridium sp. CAG:1000]|jgi:N utilization substance protein B|nr:n utilization substance protein B homolog [Clostridium sp. CAG:1000]
MKLNRTEAREKIMVILYQIDFYVKEGMSYDIDEVIKENLEIDNKFVRDVVYGVIKNIESIDKIITKYLDNWDLDRLGKTDKAILRLGTYEMLYYDTPKVVVINEAVELAKKYSDDKIVKLINAVLDKIRDNEDINE